MKLGGDLGGLKVTYHVVEARNTGATILATACPYRVNRLEDALKSQDLDEQMRVLDVSEPLAEAP